MTSVSGSFVLFSAFSGLSWSLSSSDDVSGILGKSSKGSFKLSVSFISDEGVSDRVGTGDGEGIAGEEGPGKIGVVDSLNEGDKAGDCAGGPDDEDFKS